MGNLKIEEVYVIELSPEEFAVAKELLEGVEAGDYEGAKGDIVEELKELFSD